MCIQGTLTRKRTQMYKDLIDIFMRVKKYQKMMKTHNHVYKIVLICFWFQKLKVF